MNYLFQSAQIVDVSSPYHNEVMDILIEDGMIIAVGQGLEAPEGTHTVDARGCVLTTGFAELHSDLGEPGNEESENLRSGSAAAALGGFTAVGVVSNGSPYVQNKTGVEFILNQSETLPVHLVPIGTMSKDKAGEELSEMFEMNQYGAPLFSDYKRSISNANLLKLALLYSRPFGRIMVHPENSALRGAGVMHEGKTSTYLGLKGIPEMAEHIQVARDLALLDYTEGQLHFASVSTPASLDLIKDAKERGLQVTCSVNLHHLLFDDSQLEGYPTEFKVNPPLRPKSFQDRLLQAIQDGTVDALAVDHLPKDIEQKMCEFDYAAWGMAGFEGAVAHFLDHYNLPMETVQRLLSTAPRALLDLPELSIREGETAEFTLLNERGDLWTGFASQAFNNPFKGTETKWRIQGTFAKGQYYSHHE